MGIGRPRGGRAEVGMDTGMDTGTARRIGGGAGVLELARWGSARRGSWSSFMGFYLAFTGAADWFGG